MTLTYFTARSNLVTYAFLWLKVKTVDFSETIAACDLKVGRCRQLIEIMKDVSIEGQGHFLTIYFPGFVCTRPRYQVSVYRTIGPLVNFSFYRPSRPNFLENEKKNERDYFQFFFFLFPSDSCQYITGVQLCFFILSFLLLPG